MAKYICCTLTVDVNASGALEQITVHIHSHRLGTRATAEECSGCRELAIQIIRDGKLLRKGQLIESRLG